MREEGAMKLVHYFQPGRGGGWGVMEEERVHPVATDHGSGGAFLASLLSARPMVARLAGDFYPMDDELALRPGIRRLFRTLTLMWATLCLAKAGITLWLLLSQSLETFVLVKSVSVLAMNGLAVAATIGLAVLVGRREGLLHPHPVPVPIPATA